MQLLCASRPDTQPPAHNSSADVKILIITVTMCPLQVGKEAMHFRPAEEQNAHKITCGVACSVLKQVLSHLQGRLDEAGVEANVIVSGTGDWR